MSDIYSRPKRSEIMRKIRSKDTRLEVSFRQILWHQGLRYRKHYGPYKIDIAFPGKRVALFLDSCFWHGCRAHGSVPKTNRLFWTSKIQANRSRDEATTRKLRREGWKVLRLWEHDLRKSLERVERDVFDLLEIEVEQRTTTADLSLRRP